MKQTLKHKPSHYSYQNLLVSFAGGKPLSCDELNFLAWHEKELSGERMDPISKYYLKRYHQHRSEGHSFLLPHEILNKEDIARLKKRLQILVSPKKSHIQFSMSPKQFMDLKAITYHELILYHGNQFLTGAPFYHGGIPHVIFFQWGNLFGVAKYVIQADERALKSNVLIYVEDVEERLLDQCVNDYIQTHRLELENTNRHHPTMQMQPSIQPEAPAPLHSPFKIPTLSLSKSQPDQKED